jgi:hypothetical protein
MGALVNVALEAGRAGIVDVRQRLDSQVPKEQSGDE